MMPLSVKISLSEREREGHSVMIRERGTQCDDNKTLSEREREGHSVMIRERGTQCDDKRERDTV